ncbi:hypothetical protein D3C80_2197380 [compost metagenome]
MIGSMAGASLLDARPVRAEDSPMKSCRFWSLMASLLDAGGLGAFEQVGEVRETGAG